MASPEKDKVEEEVPDLHLSFVFGNSFVKPKNPDTQCVDAQPQEHPEYYPTETVCLSRTHLKHVTDSILKNSAVKCLYLEGNRITSIPESLFISLPNLLWLDLRNNQIDTLPAEIGSHRCLKTLLLEGNPISELPAELGNVITLRGLHLRNCPITFPPQDIVTQGVHSIMQYLRTFLAMRPVSVMKTSPVELPVVEKLQLSELTGSSVEEQEESVDEAELQRFRELKHKMILLDKAELGSIAQGDMKSYPLPVIKRRKATGKASIIPELPLFDTQHWKRPEERRQAAMKELKEKQAILEQRRKSQEALRTWRSQSKPDKPKKQGKQRNQEEADTDLKPGVVDRRGSLHTQPPTKHEESRSARELERQIRAHVETIQERRRNPRGTSREQMAAAGQDMEEMRKLQTRLLERKTNPERKLEKRFIICTGDTSPSYLDN
ncbi:leucine-rich repeat-containing protein 27-like [Notolabrus celidotus]|uniref:leucine-rich repeat-containing protein 27-like n=1 Tax=Notolabrus celidotus TaxID=1203425 RepID=UPI00148F7B2C|nr:leucine-rich repeat-containing protein 27-like [Notolabrus celidotus]XP_034537487.1 leucine-rich repeat-containing protein 27-like [Notolabrus celidotus]XP_034537488.1 leucine-rich repeat-containing protein 27-like [Notolabrus celidotus]